MAARDYYIFYFWNFLLQLPKKKFIVIIFFLQKCPWLVPANEFFLIAVNFIYSFYVFENILFIKMSHFDPGKLNLVFLQCPRSVQANNFFLQKCPRLVQVNDFFFIEVSQLGPGKLNLFIFLQKCPRSVSNLPQVGPFHTTLLTLILVQISTKVIPNQKP